MTQPDPPAREGAETGGMSILLAFEEGKEVGANLTAKERAVVTAAEEWAQASHALEQADATVGAGGVSEYARLTRIARKAFDDEQGKLAALRVAVDALKENAG